MLYGVYVVRFSLQLFAATCCSVFGQRAQLQQQWLQLGLTTFIQVRNPGDVREHAVLVTS